MQQCGLIRAQNAKPPLCQSARAADATLAEPRKRRPGSSGAISEGRRRSSFACIMMKTGGRVCGRSSRNRAREARGAGARDRGALSVAAGRQRRAAGASRAARADAALLRARHGRARRFDVVHAPRRLCVQGEGGSESGGGWSEQRRSQSAYQIGRRAWPWSLAPAFCAVPRPSQGRGRGSGCGTRSGGRPGSGARRLAQSLPA